MIYEFKSRATGTVVMMKEVAETIFKIIGKEPSSKGVIVPEAMSAAMDALEQAIAKERQAPPPHENAAGEPIIRLSQRAMPFLEILREAKAANKEITWGV